MHPLYDVATVIEDAADVFCVDRAGEVGVTVMPSIPAGCADPLKKTQQYSQVRSVLPKLYCPMFPTALSDELKMLRHRL